MIPRLIHRIWLGGLEPDWQRETCRESWVQLEGEGWSLQEWTDENVETLFPLVTQRLYDRAPSFLPAEQVGQLRSDLLRYELLVRYGGVYVDADLERRRSIDELLDCEAFAAWEDERFVNNAFLGAVPGNSFLAGLVAGLTLAQGHIETRARRSQWRPNRLTGPHVLTAHYRAYPDELHVLDRALVYPYSWRELDAAGRDFDPEPFVIHHWANKRRTLGVGAPC